jgi:dephospho-CoA kinase
VTAPDDARRERSEVATTDREARLIPDEEKVRQADFAYVNDGSLDELDSFVAGVVEQLSRRAT